MIPLDKSDLRLFVAFNRFWFCSESNDSNAGQKLNNFFSFLLFKKNLNYKSFSSLKDSKAGRGARGQQSRAEPIKRSKMELILNHQLIESRSWSNGALNGPLVSHRSKKQLSLIISTQLRVTHELFKATLLQSYEYFSWDWGQVRKRQV